MPLGPIPPREFGVSSGLGLGMTYQKKMSFHQHHYQKWYRNCLCAHWPETIQIKFLNVDKVGLYPWLIYQSFSPIEISR